LANRARNALKRPAFIGAIGVGTFVTALVSMVVVPRAQRQPPQAIPVAVRPDTLTIAGDAAVGRVKFAQAESALVAVRAEVAQAALAAAAEAAAKTDTVVPLDPAVRDSLEARIKRLETQLQRAEQAPLLSSYKALADLPELRNETRVRALLDTLGEIEREREGFGAAGGVDPVFVALTSRASEIGRAIQAIASERRNAFVAQLAPAAPAEPVLAVAPGADTAVHVAARDSIRLVILGLDQELARRREVARGMDLAEARAREKATAVAPPLALLASAFVLSWVIGFAVAFLAELKKPRISSASELERFTGVRVLSTVETPMPSMERGRRQADRAAPPYFDPGAEGYQLAYLGLATDHPSLLMATVTGDDPVIAAVVACNLAAVAAEEARNTLVVDLESSCSASAALRSRIQPGVTDIIRGGVTWPDATTAARIGRDKTVDLVPHGAGAPVSTEDLIERFKQDSLRLGRYYDAIILLADARDVAQGLAGALPSTEVIYSAQPGITPLRKLRDQLESIRAAGGSIRGIVLWEAERPLLAAPRDLVKRPPRPEPKQRPEVVATS
jgi:Mrp family chromosome partitioning ATPase